jgi:hypothetical protein
MHYEPWLRVESQTLIYYQQTHLPFLCLLLGILIITGRDRVVPQHIRVLGSGNNAQVITQLLLLEVALREVLQLTLGEAEVGRRCDGQLGAITRDGNVVLSKVSGLSLNLDTLLQVLLERSNVQDLIVNRCGTVNDEFDGSLLRSLSFCLNE